MCAETLRNQRKPEKYTEILPICQRQSLLDVQQAEPESKSNMGIDGENLAEVHQPTQSMCANMVLLTDDLEEPDALIGHVRFGEGLRASLKI